MRLLASCLLVAWLGAPTAAAAQFVPYLPAAPTPEEIALEEAHELDGARALRDTGAGMTLGGLVTMGLGAAAMFVPGGFENYSGFIVGGSRKAWGGLSLLIGLPTWIAGDVRTHILDASPNDRRSVADGWELAGIVTTLTGLALLLVGGAIIGSSLAVRDDEGRRSMMTVGGALMPIGTLLATFIGPPMWGEGARF